LHEAALLVAEGVELGFEEGDFFVGGG